MAYDSEVAERVRAALAGRQVREVKMFGGLAFMVDERMVVCVSGGGAAARSTDVGEGRRRYPERPAVTQEAIWARVRKPSLRRAFSTCDSAVRRPMVSRSAIS
jgi:hypothetical protein